MTNQKLTAEFMDSDDGDESDDELSLYLRASGTEAAVLKTENVEEVYQRCEKVKGQPEKINKERIKPNTSLQKDGTEKITVSWTGDKILLDGNEKGTSKNLLQLTVSKENGKLSSNDQITGNEDKIYVAAFQTATDMSRLKECADVGSHSTDMDVSILETSIANQKTKFCAANTCKDLQLSVLHHTTITQDTEDQKHTDSEKNENTSGTLLSETGIWCDTDEELSAYLMSGKLPSESGNECKRKDSLVANSAYHMNEARNKMDVYSVATPINSEQQIGKETDAASSSSFGVIFINDNKEIKSTGKSDLKDISCTNKNDGQKSAVCSFRNIPKETEMGHFSDSDDQLSLCLTGEKSYKTGVEDDVNTHASSDVFGHSKQIRTTMDCEITTACLDNKNVYAGVASASNNSFNLDGFSEIKQTAISDPNIIEDEDMPSQKKDENKFQSQHENSCLTNEKEIGLEHYGESDDKLPVYWTFDKLVKTDDGIRNISQPLNLESQQVETKSAIALGPTTSPIHCNSRIEPYSATDTLLKDITVSVPTGTVSVYNETAVPLFNSSSGKPRVTNTIISQRAASEIDDVLYLSFVGKNTKTCDRNTDFEGLKVTQSNYESNSSNRDNSELSANNDTLQSVSNKTLVSSYKSTEQKTVGDEMDTVNWTNINNDKKSTPDVKKPTHESSGQRRVTTAASVLFVNEGSQQIPLEPCCVTSVNNKIKHSAVADISKPSITGKLSPAKVYNLSDEDDYFNDPLASYLSSDTETLEPAFPHSIKKWIENDTKVKGMSGSKESTCGTPPDIYFMGKLQDTEEKKGIDMGTVTSEADFRSDNQFPKETHSMEVTVLDVETTNAAFNNLTESAIYEDCLKQLEFKMPNDMSSPIKQKDVESLHKMIHYSSEGFSEQVIIKSPSKIVTEPHTDDSQPGEKSSFVEITIIHPDETVSQGEAVGSTMAANSATKNSSSDPFNRYLPGQKDSEKLMGDLNKASGSTVRPDTSQCVEQDSHLSPALAAGSNSFLQDGLGTKSSSSQNTVCIDRSLEVKKRKRYLEDISEANCNTAVGSEFRTGIKSVKKYDAGSNTFPDVPNPPVRKFVRRNNKLYLLKNENEIPVLEDFPSSKGRHDGNFIPPKKKKTEIKSDITLKPVCQNHSSPEENNQLSSKNNTTVSVRIQSSSQASSNLVTCKDLSGIKKISDENERSIKSRIEFNSVYNETPHTVIKPQHSRETELHTEDLCKVETREIQNVQENKTSKETTTLRVFRVEHSPVERNTRTAKFIILQTDGRYQEAESIEMNGQIIPNNTDASFMTPEAAISETIKCKNHDTVSRKLKIKNKINEKTVGTKPLVVDVACQAQMSCCICICKCKTGSLEERERLKKQQNDKIQELMKLETVDEEKEPVSFVEKGLKENEIDTDKQPLSKERIDMKLYDKIYSNKSMKQVNLNLKGNEESEKEKKRSQEAESIKTERSSKYNQVPDKNKHHFMKNCLNDTLLTRQKRSLDIQADVQKGSKSRAVFITGMENGMKKSMNVLQKVEKDDPDGRTGIFPVEMPKPLENTNTDISFSPELTKFLPNRARLEAKFSEEGERELKNLKIDMNFGAVNTDCCNTFNENTQRKAGSVQTRSYRRKVNMVERPEKSVTKSETSTNKKTGRNSCMTPDTNIKRNKKRNSKDQTTTAKETVIKGTLTIGKGSVKQNSPEERTKSVSSTQKNIPEKDPLNQVDPEKHENEKTLTSKRRGELEVKNLQIDRADRSRNIDTVIDLKDSDSVVTTRQMKRKQTDSQSSAVEEDIKSENVKKKLRNKNNIEILCTRSKSKTPERKTFETYNQLCDEDSSSKTEPLNEIGGKFMPDISVAMEECLRLIKEKEQLHIENIDIDISMLDMLGNKNIYGKNIKNVSGDKIRNGNQDLSKMKTADKQRECGSAVSLNSFETERHLCEICGKFVTVYYTRSGLFCYVSEKQAVNFDDNEKQLCEGCGSFDDSGSVKAHYILQEKTSAFDENTLIQNYSDEKRNESSSSIKSSEDKTSKCKAKRDTVIKKLRVRFKEPNRSPQREGSLKRKKLDRLDRRYNAKSKMRKLTKHFKSGSQETESSQDGVGQSAIHVHTGSLSDSCLASANLQLKTTPKGRKNKKQLKGQGSVHTGGGKPNLNRYLEKRDDIAMTEIQKSCDIASEECKQQTFGKNNKNSSYLSIEHRKALAKRKLRRPKVLKCARKNNSIKTVTPYRKQMVRNRERWKQFLGDSAFSFQDIMKGEHKKPDVQHIKRLLNKVLNRTKGIEPDKKRRHKGKRSENSQKEQEMQGFSSPHQDPIKFQSFQFSPSFSGQMSSSETDTDLKSTSVTVSCNKMGNSGSNSSIQEGSEEHKVAYTTHCINTADQFQFVVPVSTLNSSLQIPVIRQGQKEKLG